MHIRSIIKILAILVSILSLFMLLPIIFALVYKEYDELYSFLKTIALLLPVSTLFVIMLKKTDRTALTAKDGFLLVTFGWLFAALVGSIPFYISGCIPSYTDAFANLSVIRVSLFLQAWKGYHR